MMEYVLDVERRITEEPTTAREALRRVRIDGKIVAHPQPDGSWRVASALMVERGSPSSMPSSVSLTSR